MTRTRMAARSIRTTSETNKNTVKPNIAQTTPISNVNTSCSIAPPSIVVFQLLAENGQTQ